MVNHTEKIDRATDNTKYPIGVISLRIAMQ